jgi:hypothetical protein
VKCSCWLVCAALFFNNCFASQNCLIRFTKFAVMLYWISYYWWSIVCY